MSRHAKRNHNRIAAVMAHIPRYWEGGQQVLARDAGVSVAALSRLMSGEAGSQQWVVARIATALEKQLGRRVDTRDLVSEDGQYPTSPFVCALCGCPGCLPKPAFDKDNQLKERYRGVVPGGWSGDIDEFKKRKGGQ